MLFWHLTPDTLRSPRHPSRGEKVHLQIGTYPIEPGQSIWVEYQVERPDGLLRQERTEAAWQFNRGNNSYWSAQIGPFDEGNRIAYRIMGSVSREEIKGPTFELTVGPKLYLALLWHQHQPIYKDLSRKRKVGTYAFPWVRLHAIRDYYAMAALVAEHPEVHLTINLTPSLLWQIEDYVAGASDRALDLTLKPTHRLTEAEKAEILEQFFEAHWHHQIYPYPRYNALFQQRVRGEPFSDQDLDDLKMWFHLAWFAPEFQKGEVKMPDGATASVSRFLEKGSGFTPAEIKQMVEEQYKIMRNIVPIHRLLQDRGQIEVSTTPFYHPILPLLYDTDQATIDREGSERPTRFSYPEDAQEQVRRAVAFYQERFGRPPRGMWPAEGAVSSAVIPFFQQAGLSWIASDRGVLERSGRWGYRVDDPNVLCQPYRVGEEERPVALFFREPGLSDQIGFHYHDAPDPEEAAADFIHGIQARFAHRVDDPQNRILSVILDGENAWSTYPEAARPFLHALYRRIGSDPEIRTVTFSEYLLGNPERQVPSHPIPLLTQVYDLFCGSWIDEIGSRPGVDLGTWIGEPEENRAWELLGEARRELARSHATPASHPAVFEALWAAEGSDWFWWYGDDQGSERDEDFDDLFRIHLKGIYRGLGKTVPRVLSHHIIPHTVVWSFERPAPVIQPSDLLAIQTHCRGVIAWRINGEGLLQEQEAKPVGGVMAGIRRYRITLGPFPLTARAVNFIFRCTEDGCQGEQICCKGPMQTVRIEVP